MSEFITIVKKDIEDFKMDEVEHSFSFIYKNKKTIIRYLHINESSIDKISIDSIDITNPINIEILALIKFIKSIQDAPDVLAAIPERCILQHKYTIRALIPICENMSHFDKRLHFYESSFFIITNEHADQIAKIDEESTPEELTKFLSYIKLQSNASSGAYAAKFTDDGLTFQYIKSCLSNYDFIWITDNYECWDMEFGHYIITHMTPFGMIMLFDTQKEADDYIRNQLSPSRDLICGKFTVQQTYVVQLDKQELI